MQRIISTLLSMAIAGHATAQPANPIDGHFSTWKDVPGIIASMNGDDDKQKLERLHQLTRIKLGFTQSSVCLNDEEHRLYMLQTKQRWEQWWESTGKPVSIEKKRDAKVDDQAFRMAWEFLGSRGKPPEAILPVWIPETWTLCVTYSNGDYGGMEKEVWMLDRQDSTASLTKLRGDHSQGEWGASLTEYEDFSPALADRVLKALCYLHRHAPAFGKTVPENEMQGLYYPHSTLHLRDGKDRILWNTEGYDFFKTRPEYGDGESGRSCYFLRTVFADKKKWKELTKPTSQQFAPYRKFLTAGKPYFSRAAPEIVRLFGRCGGHLELESMLQWAEMQQAATDPKMKWKVCSGDFGTGSKENVINSTRFDIRETLQEIKRIANRLEDGNGLADPERKKVVELEGFVADMLAMEKREKAAELQSYPLPLRDLIQVKERPDDSDLKHLSAAIQAIRKNPDPRLFQQLVREMHEGTSRIRGLLESILLNDGDLLDLEPWGAREELIAVKGCIDALPLAKNGSRDQLLAILLQFFGGGTIEIGGEEGARRIEVKLTKDGHSSIFGGASHPLPMEQAQKELLRLYLKSRAGKDITLPGSE